MCSSYPENIPTIIYLIAHYKPKSILDIGCGNGKFGFLIKEYFYKRESTKGWPWVETVDGIDIWPKYFKSWHKEIYDNLRTGNALEMDLGKYDMYLMIDVLEHWPKDKAHKLIVECLKYGMVLVSTPKDIGDQGASGGNEWERHITQWTDGDFQKYDFLNNKTPNSPSFIYLLGNERWNPTSR